MLSVAIFRADYLRKARMPPSSGGLVNDKQRLCSNAIRERHGGGVSKNFNLAKGPPAFSKKSGISRLYSFIQTLASRLQNEKSEVGKEESEVENDGTDGNGNGIINDGARRGDWRDGDQSDTADDPLQSTERRRDRERTSRPCCRF